MSVSQRRHALTLFLSLPETGGPLNSGLCDNSSLGELVVLVDPQALNHHVAVIECENVSSTQPTNPTWDGQIGALLGNGVQVCCLHSRAVGTALFEWSRFTFSGLVKYRPSIASNGELDRPYDHFPTPATPDHCHGPVALFLASKVVIDDMFHSSGCDLG